jgi:hypothetical protein
MTSNEDRAPGSCPTGVRLGPGTRHRATAGGWGAWRPTRWSPLRAAAYRLTEAVLDALRAIAARGQAVRLYAGWNLGPIGAELSRALASHDIGFQVAVTDA